MSNGHHRCRVEWLWTVCHSLYWVILSPRLYVNALFNAFLNQKHQCCSSDIPGADLSEPSARHPSTEMVARYFSTDIMGEKMIGRFVLNVVF